MDYLCHFLTSPVDCDWPATGSMLSGMGQVASAVTVLIAARIAANTFKAWKKQKVSERLMDCAEQTVIAVLEFQSALHRVRRFMTPLEMMSAEAQLPETVRDSEDSGSYCYAQAYSNRLFAEKTVFDALVEKLPRVKSLFADDDLERSINDLLDTFAELQGLLEHLPRSSEEVKKKTIYPLMFAPFKYSRNSKPDEKIDPFAYRVAELVAAIDAICMGDIRAALQEKGYSRWLFWRS